MIRSIIPSLLLLISCIPAHAAKTAGGPSPISEVTVFKDRAFVKRRQTISLQAGNYSVIFEDLTPLLDRESIKVRVSSQDHVEVLGVRTKTRHYQKATNKALVGYEKKKEEVERDIRAIRLDVSNLLKEHSDLATVAGHYNESFTLNLHSGKWSDKEFRSFLTFLDKRSGRMHSKWKKAYLKFIKLHDELVFLTNKIREETSVSDKQKVDVLVDVTIPSKQKAWLEIQYLVKNTGWKPVYDVRINSSKANALIEQHAMVWQKTGEDWKNVKIRLSNVRTELNPEVPSISSYTLSFQKVKKVQTTVTSSIQDMESLDEAPLDEGHQVEGMARYFDVKNPQTILDGMPESKIFIQRKETVYKEHLELVGSQYPHVYKRGELNNPFPFTLVSGPVGLYYDGEFVQNSVLEDTPKTRPFPVNAGIDHSLSVKRWSESRKKKAGMINEKKLHAKDFITSIKNWSKNKKKIRVMEQVPLAEIEAIEVSHDDSTPGLKKAEKHPSWHYWEVDLAPLEDKDLTLSLEVQTPKDFQFSWPQEL